MRSSCTWLRLCEQVYVAMCYYKLDYFDVSQELLGPYLAKVELKPALALALRAGWKVRSFQTV